jgi:membrane protein YqaA with SNARE-associated domain
VFVFALLPLPLFDVAGTVAGVCKMPIAKFITACFLGKTLKMLTVAFIGQLVIPLIY